MNSEFNSKDLSSCQDRLTDALLSEHARLGKKRDEDLVSNILLNTVNAPLEISQFTPAPKEIFRLSDWAKVAAVVFVIASLGALALNEIGSGSRLESVEKRHEETFHLVVDYQEIPREEKKTLRMERKVLITVQPGTNQVMPVASGANDSIPAFRIADSDLMPPPPQFGRSIKDLSSVSSSFKLASNDSTSTGGKIIYSGEVVLTHDNFILEADSLVMDRSAGEVPVLKALNATLTHIDGIFEAEADAVSFDPSTGKLVAKGVQRLFSRGFEQKIVNPAAFVVFENDDFFIQEGFAQPF